MATKLSSKTPLTQTDPAPVVIPTPPGGGSWRWDETVLQWLPNEQPIEPTPQAQE